MVTAMTTKLIMVVDVAAETGGAMTILKQYYAAALAESGQRYIFLLGKTEFASNGNIEVVKHPWVKKSWLHRLAFDLVVAPAIARRRRPDEIISLQNITIRCRKAIQRVYVRQPLPFQDTKYSIITHPRYWVYQRVISRLIYRSIRAADEVIVQTRWMKEACVRRTAVQPEKITISPPLLEREGVTPYRRPDTQGTNFFYPASAEPYKNHWQILQAVAILTASGIRNYKVTLTIDPRQSSHAQKLANFCTQLKLPVVFTGYLSPGQVDALYSQSILIFTSLIETFGLPLLEARMRACPIIACDMPFSREILDGYDQIHFITPGSAQELAQAMSQSLKQGES